MPKSIPTEKEDWSEVKGLISFVLLPFIEIVSADCDDGTDDRVRNDEYLSLYSEDPRQFISAI